MTHTKSQYHRPSGSGDEDFLTAKYNCSNEKNILHKYWLTYHKEPSHEILDQLGQRFVWKLCFNILMGLQYERSKLKGQRSTLTFGTNQ